MNPRRDDRRDGGADQDPHQPDGVRLQKVLAAAGVASRRAAEDMIAHGRVEVNGQLILEQGLRVNPDQDEIRVDGSRIPTARRHVYLALNKPRGVVTTLEDPEGRPTVADLLVGRSERLFHVGRLDTDTEGLLLVTNDGEFAHRLAHPSYEVPKTYLAEVEGAMTDKELTRLRTGLRLEDGPVKPDQVTAVQRMPERTMIEITLHEGRNRIVRRMMDSVGHPVRRLVRTAVGPVRLARLPVGELRELRREELGALLDLVQM
ncbi:pseudouridine synthase [Parenemella sanctibonifatiensis]|uniref:Pseudouridine synthase n=1 Tax=Parenemella sanctibonifatiensis TaxID=2016505 RepID=A0A255EID7_9ACTN|nr:pseudouridine synthase [Parenemella sanctibonifatiensis]OYN91299.1 MFS transporter [Parenemella sanctibonifatiensis]